MQLGISSFCYRYAVKTGRLDALALVQRAAELGLALVQFCDNLPLHQLSPSKRQELRQTAKQLGIRIEVGTRGLIPQQLQVYAELATEMGSHTLRLVLDSQDQNAVQKALTPLLKELGRRNVTLAIENHASFPSEELASLVQSFETAPIGICLDTANSIGLLEHPLYTTRVLAPLAVQLHLKDYVIERAAIGYHVTGRPLGEGWLDIPAVIKELDKVGFDGDCLLELWMDPAKDLEETLLQEHHWIEQSVRRARELLRGTKDE